MAGNDGSPSISIEIDVDDITEVDDVTPTSSFDSTQLARQLDAQWAQGADAVIRALRHEMIAKGATVSETEAVIDAIMLRIDRA